MMDVKVPRFEPVRCPSPIDPNPAIAWSSSRRTDAGLSDGVSVFINYRDLPRDVEGGATILIDSGLLRLEIVDKDASRVWCRVVTHAARWGHDVTSTCQFGVDVNLPALTEKDRAMCSPASRRASTSSRCPVRRPDDAAALVRAAGRGGPTARIIAKIEDQSGLRNLDAIVRGGCGDGRSAAISASDRKYHVLPIVQRRIVATCLAAGKPGHHRDAPARVDDECADADARARSPMYRTRSANGLMR